MRPSGYGIYLHHESGEIRMFTIYHRHTYPERYPWTEETLLAEYHQESVDDVEWIMLQYRCLSENLETLLHGQ